MTRLVQNNLSDYLAISEAFVRLHERDGFARLPSSSLLHENLPTSFVMSAGLVQVEHNLEQIVRDTGGKFTFTQPCFRSFDMAQVGNDRTHLSLFHMSAAFHIGSCQRETLLPRLWHFLTEILRLEKNRLWVTYLDDPHLGKDEASYACWQQIGVDKQHLLGQPREHNFWQQKKTGQIAKDGRKCGSHTEVFYERPTHFYHCPTPETCSPHCHCGRFIEVSNSLFIEDYLADDGSLLKAEHIFSECVIGIERLMLVLENAEDIHHIKQLQPYRSILLEAAKPHDDVQALHRHLNIIQDHLHAFATLYQHGAPEPGRGGRARLMKQLARGAMTHAILAGIDLDQAMLQRLLPNRESTTNCLLVAYKKYAKSLQKGQRMLEQFSNKQKGTIDDALRKTIKTQCGMPDELINFWLKSCL